MSAGSRTQDGAGSRPRNGAASHAQARAGGRLARLAAPAALLVLPLALLLPAIGAGRTVFGVDFANVFYFTRAWVASELRAGRLPVWDPHTLCGFPLLAAVQSAVFYPPAWLEVVLPRAAFWTFAAWLHLALAGLFAEAWLRRGLGLGRRAALGGALVFALSGYLFTHLYAGHVGYVWAYPWGAFALWRLERWLAAPRLRRAVLLGLPLPLMVVAGVPQLAFATGLVLGVRLGHFVATGRAAARLRVAAGAVAALGVGVLLAAPQVLPTLELASQAQRVAVNDASFVTSFSLPPENLLTFVAPTVLGDAVDTRYWGRWHLWEICGYVGVVGVALAGLGAATPRPQRRLWVGLALLAVLVALGRHTPAFAVFRALVPGAALFRGPGRYLYVFVLATAALSGFALQAIAGDEPGARRAARRAALLALALAAALGVTALASAVAGSESAPWRAVFEHARRARAAWSRTSGVAPLPVGDPSFRAASHAAAGHALVLAGAWSAATGALLLAFGTGRLGARATTALAVTLLAADLLAFDRRYVRAQELAPLEWSPGEAAVLTRETGGDFRLTSTRRADVADAGRARLAGLAHAGGYEPLLLERYADLVNLVDGQPPERPVVLATVARPHPVAQIMGTKVWLAPQGTVAPRGLRPVRALRDGREVLESRAALPRASVVPRAVVLGDRRERLAYLGRQDFDPRAVVVLEDERLRDEQPVARREAGSARIVAQRPGEYVIDADAPDGGFLVLAEAHFPGWRAWVDGREAEPLRANHLFQAVRLAPGVHRVRFAYHSRRLTDGLALAAAALLVPLAIALAARARRRRHAGAER